MIRVLLADDHPIVREGVRRLFEAHPDFRVVGEVADGADVVAALDARPTDVLLLDLSLPHLSGLELVALVRERHPAVRILVFTMAPEDTLALHYFERGVSGFLTKGRPAEELLNAVRKIAGGGRYLPDTLKKLETTAELPHTTLTAREYQVFVALLGGASVYEIAGVLEIGASTVSNHLARVRQKLGVETNAEILIYAHRIGLLR